MIELKYFLIVLAAAVAVLVILLLIAVIRAVRMKVKPSDRKPAIHYTPEEEAKYAHMLSEMIKVPTVSVPEGGDKSIFYELQDVMKELFPLVFSKLEKTDLNGNMLFRWPGRNPELKPILLMGHQDVVPASDKNWKHGPFSGDIEDGIVHGRGAMDCKCTVMAEFAAVEELLAEGFVPERDVYLSSSTNEEISGGGVEVAVKYFQDKGIRLESVMDEGGAIVSEMLPGMSTWAAAVGIVEKGTSHIKFIAKGAGGHSSAPPNDTPIARLSAFVCEVEKKKPFKKEFTEPVRKMFDSIAPYLSFPFRLLMGNVWLFKPLLIALMPMVSPMALAFLATTCVFTMSGGSDAPNVIPDEAYVIANIRPSIQQNAEESIEILKKIAAKYDLEAEVIYASSASGVVNTDGEEFRYIGECVKECFPEYCFTPYYMCGGTDCRNFEPVTDNCMRFTPIRMNKQQIAAMHAPNENIGTDALAEGVKFYKYYIKNHK